MKDTQRRNIAVSLLRLLEPGDVVYLRKPEEESDQELSSGLQSLISELKSDGPFSVTKSIETPDSSIAIQEIQFGPLNSDAPFTDKSTGLPVCFTGYIFETRH